MKPKIVYCWILLALAVGLAWYNHQYHCYGYPFLTNPSGLAYKATGQGNGRKVKDNDWVKLSFVTQVIPKEIVEQAEQSSSKEVEQAKQSSGKEVEQAEQSSSKEVEQAKQSSGKEIKKVKKNIPKKRILIDQSKPFFFQFDESFQSSYKCIAEMIHMMQEKQQMVFKCTLGYYFEGESPENLQRILKTTSLNKEDELLTSMKLDKIMTDAEYKQMLETRRATQLAKDKELITSYLAKHHMEASSTESGLFYIIDQPSDGTPVVKNKTVKVHYTGRLLDGSIFDTSLEEVAKANNRYNPQRSYSPLAFPVGVGLVIPGWDEGLLLLKKGEKARFFIPSALAYGERGAPPLIPKNAILLFEVEVLDVCEATASQPNDSQSSKSKSK
ncbi:MULTISPECIES: FKBP-type peptidyl-prolyl cis-trans isomerase [unclassified Candidatus Cardinium]|uniref:FKBP-type peptidyl-prolyl cis-trans isomerase n=1 Tax=unclassified Candidatus Cardinium TaxID=2641185 RepID=UPI001FB4CB58|nr:MULTISPECIES: FKBP-type peptidyl-prolyl cis-trans isomerase [unclassified Candidatus Cardinium]